MRESPNPKAWSTQSNISCMPVYSYGQVSAFGSRVSHFFFSQQHMAGKSFTHNVLVRLQFGTSQRLVYSALSLLER